MVWELADEAGSTGTARRRRWGTTTCTPSLRSGTDNVVDLYFPPAHDEAPPSGSTAPTMTLLTLLPGVSTVYTTTFAGGDWNLSARANPLDNQPAPSPGTDNRGRASGLACFDGPEYDTIDLPANTTIIVTQPLEITHSVAIIGDNSTLLFQQGSSAAWPASASGAIYVDAPAYHNVELTLSGFTHPIRHE